MATAEAILTAEEYWGLPDHGQPSELIGGRIVPMNMPGPRHGQVCLQVGYLLRRHLETNDLGHVVSNDTGIITERNPDTVRGADVAFFSYTRVPRGPLPENYLSVAPEVVFEVLSPSDRWSELHLKIGEYLHAEVLAVCILDPVRQTIQVFYPDQPVRIFTADADLTLPDVLGDFRVPVRRFFE